jgi:hypothetical protein
VEARLKTIRNLSLYVIAAAALIWACCLWTGIELPVMAIAVMEIADIAAVPLLIYALVKRNR